MHITEMDVLHSSHTSVLKQLSALYGCYNFITYQPQEYNLQNYSGMTSLGSENDTGNMDFHYGYKPSTV